MAKHAKSRRGLGVKAGPAPARYNRARREAERRVALRFLGRAVRMAEGNPVVSLRRHYAAALWRVVVEARSQVGEVRREGGTMKGGAVMVRCDEATYRVVLAHAAKLSQAEGRPVSMAAALRAIVAAWVKGGKRE